MDARELREIVDGVANRLPEALLENKGIEQLAFSIGKIASYLQSEQEKRIALGIEMKETTELIGKHEKLIEKFDRQIFGDDDNLDDKPGIAREMAESRRRSKRNEKLIGALVVTVLADIAVKLLPFLMHLPPVK
jgi:hypothetical protein